MAGFDPDAYLAAPKTAAFDPDAYLAAQQQVNAPAASRVIPGTTALADPSGNGVLPPVNAKGESNYTPQEKTTIEANAKQNISDIAGGMVRGAGSIGTTLITPYDLAAGNTKSLGNPERRQAMDAGLQTMGANPNSGTFKTMKTLAEIAGTAGMGGMLANGASKIPYLAQHAPGFINALRSSGMTTGAVGGNTLANLATRVGGGAISGGAQAAMVDPASAGTGALIGGALPVFTKVAGVAGDKLGSMVRGPAQTSEQMAAVKAATDAGYVIPPSQAKPTLVNRLLEGVSGKISTAQNASAKNSVITDGLAAKSIGLAQDTKITPDVLNDVRKTAAQAYEAVASLPVKPAQTASSVTNTPAIAEINPKEMVFDLRKARNDADAWYRSYGRTADPDALVKAQTAKNLATKLQTGLEDYASSVGRDDLVPAMVESRKLIAKTYTVEKALNPTTGTIDARKLGALIDKGKPLTDELRQAGEFANRFPKAAQTVEKMGSLPQTSPLDWATGGAIGAATGNSLGLAMVAARPTARAAALSGFVQRGLSQPQSNGRLLEFLSSPEGQQLLARTAPIAATQ